MPRPIEKIGLYILFALVAVVFLVLLTEVVWGHGEDCYDHFTPCGTGDKKPSGWCDEIKLDEHLDPLPDERQPYRYKGGHGHDYGGGSWGYWRKDAYEAVEDKSANSGCDLEPPTVTTVTIPSPKEDIHRHYRSHDENGWPHNHDYSHDRRDADHIEGHSVAEFDHDHDTPPPSTTPDPIISVSTPVKKKRRSDSSDDTTSEPVTVDMTPSEVSDTVERSLQTAVETQEDMPDEIPASEEEMEEEIVELVYHGTQWYKGYNLVSFPVLPPDIVTISDFYHRWSFFNSPQDSIIVRMDGWWFAYTGGDNAVGDLEITPYLGVVMLHDWSVYLGLHGVPVIGDGVLELESGHHLVGLSEIPEGFTKPSDFLDVPGIYWVATRTTADVVEIPEWHSIGREGDPGDEHPLYLGQAVLLVVEEATEIVFRERVASAPQAQRRGTLTTSWGAMKR